MACFYGWIYLSIIVVITTLVLEIRDVLAFRRSQESVANRGSQLRVFRRLAFYPVLFFAFNVIPGTIRLLEALEVRSDLLEGRRGSGRHRMDWLGQVDTEYFAVSAAMSLVYLEGMVNSLYYIVLEKLPLELVRLIREKSPSTMMGNRA